MFSFLVEIDDYMLGLPTYLLCCLTFVIGKGFSCWSMANMKIHSTKHGFVMSWDG